ncbi:imelysin family protein [Epibacterium ulvae]|uniref:imelysin family protein n=1 Tax=Epibacterium ulvae TaxID=1156985 RepID=UPI001BFBFC69|nr:imelysin family protein [Epibacterium ulvae]MBT8154338.1 imelysin family protein [Epibacterium ulvae]
MRYLSIPLICASFASPLHADELTQSIVDTQILPAFDALAQHTQTLAQSTADSCLTAPAEMEEAFATSFDAWVTASIWRFGPSETDSRAFSLAFWPDNRGKIGKAVRTFLSPEDREVLPPEVFAQQSIAGKGFYALEFLMFDADAKDLGSAAYRCDLAQAMTTDIASTAQAIQADWTGDFRHMMQAPSERYQSNAEVRQELFKALTTGLQIVDDLRLGRPLGTFDKPRPRRAEAWRSDRSLRHVVLSLQALEPLALALAQDAPALQAELAQDFTHATERATALDDPRFSGVADPGTRFRIEAVKQEVVDLRALVAAELGPLLGVAAGFNSLDGD